MYTYIVCLGDGILNYHITIQPLRRVAVVPCGDGRTRTAVFYRSSLFNKVFIFNTLSLFEYNAIYLYISKSVCKFVCTF